LQPAFLMYAPSTNNVLAVRSASNCQRGSEVPSLRVNPLAVACSIYLYNSNLCPYEALKLSGIALAL